MLKVLNAALFGFDLGQIANETDEDRLTRDPRFADREFEGKGRAVPPLASHDAANSDDPLDARLDVICDVAIMLHAKMPRHQHFHVLAENVFARITEKGLSLGIEVLDQAVRVDGDDRIV